ncbi:MAG: Co2+/Mg2+ efflux protein ApaG [Deltaproteobacteria bacterium]|nr:Co2+/Mg2+ efflux protein ApaG [Deltaproteobacteria bacterium]MBW2360058.1 Co2+/Mg2+ efflux protein ApaG [Deltaproteobacteria bacterium]
MTASEAVTRCVRIEVETRYSPDHSTPGTQWFFLYTITIHNEGDEPVQLVARHWLVTDGTGRVEEVHGPGVVGEQPVIEPAAAFQYTSGCPLPTPYGSMEGRYEMVTGTGERFVAAIGRFQLSEPGAIH